MRRGARAAGCVFLVFLVFVTTTRAAPRQDLWRSILSRHVTVTGLVAYRSLAGNDASSLETYLDSLAEVDPESLSRDGEVAFWLNAYNALVLWAVLQGERPETPEGRSRLYHWVNRRIGMEDRTLDAIERELRPHAALDPRIHLARTNGTLSGPPLFGSPFEGERLDSQLAVVTRRFFRRPSPVDYDLKENRLELPILFAWYREDFERTAGSLTAYVRDHVEHPLLRELLDSGDVIVEFRRPDWSLNAAPGQMPE